MAIFDMLGYLVMPPIIDYFGRVRSLTGSYIITSSAIIISSLLTYFEVPGVNMLCRILGEFELFTVLADDSSALVITFDLKI